MRLLGKTWTGGDISFKCFLDDVTGTRTGRGARNIRQNTRHSTEIQQYVRRYTNRDWVCYLNLPMTGTNIFDFANNKTHKFVVKSPIKLNPQDVGYLLGLGPHDKG